MSLDRAITAQAREAWRQQVWGYRTRLGLEAWVESLCDQDYLLFHGLTMAARDWRVKAGQPGDLQITAFYDPRIEDPEDLADLVAFVGDNSDTLMVAAMETFTPLEENQ